MPPADSNATPLPPSVEAAYYRKCIALKRRLNEIEANNDAARLRKARLDRAILKMRLERAFLLERLAERMVPNVDESDRSTSPPPTPQEKPTRSKRSHRQKTPPLESHHSGSVPPHHSPANSASNAQQPHLHPVHAIASTHSTPDPHRSGSGIYSFGGPGNALAASPMPGLNGTPSTPFSGTGPPPVRPLSGLPLPQPQFVDGGYDERQRRTTENGSSGSGDFARAYAPGGPGAPGSTGEMVSAGPEIRADANGERRIAQDTEMGEAQQPAGFGAGFTAVNR